MAEIAVTTNSLDVIIENGVRVTKWETVTNGDTGAQLNVADLPDKTVQVIGTFGTGGSINIEGSNDGTNWEILTDIAGSAITLTAAGMRTITENPLYMRPNVTAGDGSTDLDVLVVSRGT